MSNLKQCKNCKKYFDARYEPDVCINCTTGKTQCIKGKIGEEGYEITGSRPYIPENNATVPYVEKS